MRKYSCVLTVLLLFFDIPLFAQSRSQVTKSDVKSTAKSALTPPRTLQLEFVGYENRFWKAMVSKDFRIINDLIAEDALFIDDDNIVSKAEFMKTLSSYTPSQYLFTGLKVRLITVEVCIVSYKVKTKYSFNATKMPVTTSLVTSVWVNEGGKWRIKHQHSGLMPVTKADP